MLNFFRFFSNFDLSILNFEVTLFSLLQGLSKCACISIFFGMIFLFYEHCLSQVSSKWHFNQTCHFLLFKRKFSYNHWKAKYSIKEFFSKYDQIRSFLRIWSYLLKKSLMENFIFCAVNLATKPSHIGIYCIKSFLKSHSFQETRANSAVFSKANTTDKIILNIFGVAI